jgi:hypothetical protein
MKTALFADPAKMIVAEFFDQALLDQQYDPAAHPFSYNEAPWTN